MTSQIKHNENYNIIATDADGVEHLAHANELQIWDLHHWSGWHCGAGVDYLYVTENGDAWGSQCENDYLGNVYQGITMLEEYTVCRQPSCTGCINDLLVHKYQGD